MFFVALPTKAKLIERIGLSGMINLGQGLKRVKPGMEIGLNRNFKLDDNK